MKKKIANLTLSIPQKRAGNVICQEKVTFDVFQADGHYTLVPHLTEDERRKNNLPHELNFMVEDGKPVSLRGNMDGNFHVISDAFQQMQENQVFNQA
jgi:hypothetical protein